MKLLICPAGRQDLWELQSCCRAVMTTRRGIMLRQLCTYILRQPHNVNQFLALFHVCLGFSPLDPATPTLPHHLTFLPTCSHFPCQPGKYIYLFISINFPPDRLQLQLFFVSACVVLALANKAEPFTLFVLQVIIFYLFWVMGVLFMEEQLLLHWIHWMLCTTQL